jgi:pyrimidine and pyridine-specific 5'-nucleotidase
MFVKAMRDAGVTRVEDCYFVGMLEFREISIVPADSAVDDSYLNCSKAQEFGWSTVHLVEESLSLPQTPASLYQIRHLRELRSIYPQFFKSANAA